VAIKIPNLQPDYTADGVDLALIRWMLSLTPAERLEASLLLPKVDADAELRILRYTLEERRRMNRPVC
jgi:hypothetical protein